MSRAQRIVPAVLGVRVDGGLPAQVRPMVVGRLVVVTGASRGIGRCMAERLTQAGARVVAVARDEAALRSLPDAVEPRVLDLRDTAAAGAAAERLVAESGIPGLVISNAGHSIHRYLEEYTERFHDVARLSGVNLLGPIAFLLPLLREMMRAGSGQLISVSTVNVDVPLPGWSAYTATKSGFDAWLDAVSPELRRAGVRATSLHLPRVRTAMSAPTAGRYPVPELTVDQAADVICRAIVRRPRLVRPWWAAAGGSLVRLAPGAMDALLARGLSAGWRF
ncbi:MAG: SDR family NAD(P)-dependent oxidoreductase [Actinobacteria bacterium]|nr:SDR family NAD(P)-dependent oxidoreductase [Actinomycetota bacterium]